MKYNIILMLTFVLTIIAATSQAQHNPRIKVRTQTHVGTGINPREAFYLRQMKADLRRDYVRAKMNDGRIGPLERRHLQQERRQVHRAELRFRYNRQR
jgi:hypothetical protein